MRSRIFSLTFAVLFGLLPGLASADRDEGDEDDERSGRNGSISSIGSIQLGPRPFFFWSTT